MVRIRVVSCPAAEVGISGRFSIVIGSARYSVETETYLNWTRFMSYPPEAVNFQAQFLVTIGDSGWPDEKVTFLG